MIPLRENAKDQLSPRIYITDLSFDVDAADLRRIFETVGVVLDVKIVKTTTSNEPSGLGYVEVGNEFNLRRVFKEINGEKIKGCHIRLYDRRYGPVRRIISDRRQHIGRRKKDMVPLLQLNEITSTFIKIDSHEQVERRISEHRILDERRMGERRSG